MNKTKQSNRVKDITTDEEIIQTALDLLDEAEGEKKFELYIQYLYAWKAAHESQPKGIYWQIRGTYGKTWEHFLPTNKDHEYLVGPELKPEKKD